jgi:glyoxylase-like metal-dependent hydrolase (beta-lactamase superfamily II)
VTLVDTMIPRRPRRSSPRPVALGRPIVRIALTHAHGDYVHRSTSSPSGCPGVEVAISARDACRLLEGDNRCLARVAAVACFRGSYPGTPARRRGLLSAGDRVGSL